MLIPRVIPCLLLKGEGLVKGVNFKNHRYIGDPFNAISIFNTKEVDELILLDTQASLNNRCVSPELVRMFSSECLMPLTVGGGINTLDEVSALLSAGAEKVTLNTSAFTNPSLITEIANKYGSQSVVVSIDVKNNWRNKTNVVSLCATKRQKNDPITTAKMMEEYGAGEILLNSVDREGTMHGYDIPLISMVTEAVNIPVIASGGAGKLDDFRDAIFKGGAAAVSAGSMFVFHGPRRAVLISYPSRCDLEKTLQDNTTIEFA